MTISENPTAAAVPGVPARHLTRQGLSNPATVFLLLSALFGTLTAVLTPPLCAPDEAAHFMRAYGLSQGEIIPSRADEKGRKGVYLPARLYREFDFFDAARYQVNVQHFDYRRVMSEYLRRRAASASTRSDGAAVFVLYAGSEGYSPVAYLPYVAAVALARLIELDFAGTLYLMRFAGLAAMTAVVAYAIAVVPGLGWTFLCIAMLPAALYGRSVVSADGSALAYVMAIAALSLRAVASVDAGRPLERSLWMMLCGLSKPPQLAFILLEAMQQPLRDLPRVWRRFALVTLPAVLVVLFWAAASFGEMATWRLTDHGFAPEQFDAVWKLRFMLEHPFHFPKLLIGSLQNPFELWRQLIGILGWLDAALQPWVYPAASLFLFATFLARLDLDSRQRRRVALVAGVTALTYCLAVYGIFYLFWTPTDSDHVHGVQGRYFVVALPAFAIAAAAILNRAPGQNVTAPLAIVGAMLSGAATIEAVLRVDWKIW
jgi:uncharacterized membrane protein